MKRLAFATALLVLLTIAATGAWADAIPPQITLGPPPPNAPGAATSIAFTKSAGSSSFNFVTNCGAIAHCISGSGSFDPLGIDAPYTVWIKGPSTTLTFVDPSDYSVGMGTATMFLDIKLGAGGSLGDLLAAVVLTDLFGVKGPAPSFVGNFTTISSSGSFVANFPVGTPGSLDFTVQLGKHPTFGPLPVGKTTSGYLSSGEVVAPVVVPEPSSLALLGTGVLGLAALLRRKMIH